MDEQSMTPEEKEQRFRAALAQENPEVTLWDLLVWTETPISPQDEDLYRGLGIPLDSGPVRRIHDKWGIFDMTIIGLPFDKTTYNENLSYAGHPNKKTGTFDLLFQIWSIHLSRPDSPAFGDIRCRPSGKPLFTVGGVEDRAERDAIWTELERTWRRYRKPGRKPGSGSLASITTAEDMRPIWDKFLEECSHLTVMAPIPRVQEFADWLAYHFQIPARKTRRDTGQDAINPEFLVPDPDEYGLSKDTVERKLHDLGLSYPPF